MDCYICLDEFLKIPLLNCGHFVCPKCYCDLKQRKINSCCLCKKKLTRKK